MGDPGPGRIRLLLAELRRRRVLRVAAVYAVVAWAVLQVAVTVAPLLALPAWTPTLILLLLVLGFPPAVALSWTFAWTPEQGWRREAPAAAGGEVAPTAPPAAGLRASPRRRRALAYLGAALLVVLIGLAAYARLGTRLRGGRAPAITSVAVLPFVNLSRDPENEYFSDGVADELLNQLTKVQGLNVAARTSSFYFKGRNLPIKEIARQLDVGALVEGSVQRAGGRLRITAQVIDARTGYHVWSERYDRDARDLFAVEDEIARAIVAALSTRLAGAVPAPRHEPDATTHDLYLRGRFLLNRGSRQDLEGALARFEQAIARDSAYADPLAAAATVWGLLADAYVAPLEAYPKSAAYAERAIALDDANAEAHANLAYARMVLDWDWAGARRELERALQLNPRDAQAHANLTAYLWNRGDPRGALAAAREAARLDPFSAMNAFMLVTAWCHVGEPDSALAAFRRLEEIALGFVYGDASAACAYRMKGRYADALALDQAAVGVAGAPSYSLVASLLGLGRKTEAEETYREMIERSRAVYFSPEDLARSALALGHRDEALDWLERGVAAHSAMAPLIALWPDLRPLHADPRFQRLLREMHLDDEGL